MRIEISEKELFYLGEALKPKTQKTKRVRFGLGGLRTRLYEEGKKTITPEAYQTLKDEWDKVNPPETPEPPKAVPKIIKKKNDFKPYRTSGYRSDNIRAEYY